jgi:hypothetical protein
MRIEFPRNFSITKEKEVGRGLSRGRIGPVNTGYQGEEYDR